jgi:hypothetical protein
MSDPNVLIQRQIQDLQDGHERLRKADVPALYLPWVQRALNPFPLASSGGVFAEMGLPWLVNVLAFYVTVLVDTTNNGTNFWTLDLRTFPAGTTIASVNTSAIAANTYTPLSDLTITQPVAADVALFLQPVATLSPGAIYIFPSVALLRAGN